MTSCSRDASKFSSARHMNERGLLMQSGRMVTRRGWTRGPDGVKQLSSSDALGVVGTSSLDALPDVEEEAERAGEPGASSPNMRSASSIENVYEESVTRGDGFEGRDGTSTDSNGRVGVGEGGGEISYSFSESSGIICSGGGLEMEGFLVTVRGERLREVRVVIELMIGRVEARSKCYWEGVMSDVASI